MFIESIQIINSTTLLQQSLTKNKENVFLNNFTKPLNEKEKNILSICNSFDTNFSKDELLNYLYSLSVYIKH